MYSLPWMSLIVAPRPSTTTSGSAASEAWWSGWIRWGWSFLIRSAALTVAIEEASLSASATNGAARRHLGAPVAGHDARPAPGRTVVHVDPGLAGLPVVEPHRRAAPHVETPGLVRWIVPL